MLQPQAEYQSIVDDIGYYSTDKTVECPILRFVCCLLGRSVVAAVIKMDNKIFATQRGYGEFKGGWEFPGGSVLRSGSPGGGSDEVRYHRAF